MRYKTIIKPGFEISEISFGCMSLQPGQDHSELIKQALDGGINLFDTADLYDKGENEILLGKLLKGKRKDIYISTKAGNRWRADGSGWDWCPEKKYILQAVDESLQRLQTDYIDLYLLHGGTMEDPIDETIEAFERIVEMGKIRAYGISSIRPAVIREYVQRANISAVMTQYSLLDRRPEEQTLRLLQQHNIGVLARGTVAGGLLAGKPVAPYLGMDENEITSILKKIDFAKPESKTITDTALRYVADNPAVTSAVVGIRTENQLNDAFRASESKPLNTEEYNRISVSWEANRYEAHR